VSNLCCPCFWSLFANRTSSAKPEVHGVSQRISRDVRADRQTDRQTDRHTRSSQYSAPQWECTCKAEMLVMRLMLKNPTEMQSKRNKETDDDAHFKDAIKVIFPVCLECP